MSGTVAMPSKLNLLRYTLVTITVVSALYAIYGAAFLIAPLKASTTVPTKRPSKPSTTLTTSRPVHINGRCLTSRTQARIN